jgi:septum formation protein
MRSAKPVVLASASPRRRELLARILNGFQVLPAEVDEEALTVQDPHRTAERLAEAKAKAVLNLRPEARIIGADTVVALREGDAWRQLAKPADAADAARMLRALSGRSHIVVTGVCLADDVGTFSFSDTTVVGFRALDEAEIAAYVATGEPMDKAGAYAVQGGAAEFVQRLKGSHSNVVGLPLERLEAELRRRWPDAVLG